jgi:hypothetical protein
MYIPREKRELHLRKSPNCPFFHAQLGDVIGAEKKVDAAGAKVGSCMTSQALMTSSADTGMWVRFRLTSRQITLDRAKLLRSAKGENYFAGSPNQYHAERS